MNKFYTAQEIADKLKIKKNTVYELIKRGELSSSKVGKQLRVSEEQLALYLKTASSSQEISLKTPDFQPESSLLKSEYPVGLYVKKGNPKNIENIRDLTRPDITFANREKGSTRRIFLDRILMKEKISPGSVSGYERELVSDLSTAAAIIDGRADTALGEELIIRQTQALSFLPMEKLPMYLVMKTTSMEKPGFAPLLEIIRSEEYRTILKNQTGYDTSHTGEIRNLP